MAADDFPYIEVSDHLKKILGEPLPNTRLYQRFGPKEEFEAWWTAVREVCGPSSCVSPGGVSMIARVSRAGVHKRMKEGRLTAFLFYVTRTKRGLLGEKETLEHGGKPYTYIPGSECEAWAEQMSRMTKEERMREAIGDGDYEGAFLVSKPRKKKPSRRQGGFLWIRSL